MITPTKFIFDFLYDFTPPDAGQHKPTGKGWDSLLQGNIVLFTRYLQDRLVISVTNFSKPQIFMFCVMLRIVIHLRPFSNKYSLFFPQTCHSRQFGPKGYGYGVGAGTLSHTAGSGGNSK